MLGVLLAAFTILPCVMFVALAAMLRMSIDPTGLVVWGAAALAALVRSFQTPARLLRVIAAYIGAWLSAAGVWILRPPHGHGSLLAILFSLLLLGPGLLLLVLGFGPRRKRV
jgi:hypothetical protein